MVTAPGTRCPQAEDRGLRTPGGTAQASRTPRLRQLHIQVSVEQPVSSPSGLGPAPRAGSGDSLGTGALTRAGVPASVTHFGCGVGMIATRSARVCPRRGVELALFSQLTYRDWLQLELEIEPDMDSLSDMER